MSTLGNHAAFSWAIMSFFLWLMPHISMEIGEYHRALHKSFLWPTEEFQTTGKRAIRHAVYEANLIGVLLIVGAACGIALNTKNLVNNMVKIIFGLSHLMGASVVFALSWNFPEWLEVYNIRPRKDVLPVSRSVKALKFNVLWSILSQYCRVYFLLLPFYCGARAAFIAVSAIVGIAIGAIVDLCVYWGRQHVNKSKARWIVFVMIFAAVVGSGLLFASGCMYINDVWGNRDDRSVTTVGVGTFFAWVVVGLAVHYLFWHQTKDTVQEMHMIFTSTKYKNPLGEAIKEKGPEQLGSATKKAKAAVQRVSRGGKEKSPERELEDGDPLDIAREVAVKINTGEKLPQAQLDDDDIDPLDEEGEKPTTTVEFANELEEMEQHRESTPPNLFYDDEAVEDPTFCALLKSKCCCDGGSATCCYCARKETPLEKAFSCAKWTIWFVLSAFSLYFIAVNIGATYQQDVVRAKLPSVKNILYEDMNNIEVCAYDGDGSTGSLNKTSNITTFPSKDAAHDAGFLILHCGSCGACSNWPNIKYEYTTRTFLTAESKKCATKSLFGGSDAVQACLEGPPIQWHGKCAQCWTTDILCAKKYCTFNYLQSTMINTMTKFSVGINEVTAASCEEANCEAFPYPKNFVECSGATRRRMNVTSMIARPKDEECANVEVSWVRLFPGE